MIVRTYWLAAARVIWHESDFIVCQPIMCENTTVAYLEYYRDYYWRLIDVPGGVIMPATLYPFGVDAFRAAAQAHCDAGEAK